MSDADTSARQPVALIAGCGDLGTEVGLRLAAAGQQVIGLRRRAAQLPAPITGWSADLTQPLTLPEGLPGPIDVLVLSAAAGGGGEAGYRAVYLEGTRHVLDALERAGQRPARVVLVSSTGVHGTAGEVDEGTPPQPARATGHVLLEAEQLLRDRHPDAVVLRLAGIYGPGRTRLIDAVREGTARIPDPDVTTNRIHRDDAARAVVALATVSDPPTTVIGVDDAPVGKGEVLRFLADELGLPPPPVATDGSRRATDKRCRNTVLRGVLDRAGTTLAFPSYREGYRAILAGQGTRHQ
ncbi:MAG: NAD(P)H-binding protein [Nitriliruptoraceae bacterium]|nr:NAD(P)H-binding protein [Nitriliruptoraceae bacterium]